MLIGAKWAITASKLSLALWTAEIAPTSTRTVFYGICLGASACGVVASSAMVCHLHHIHQLHYQLNQQSHYQLHLQLHH